MHEELLTCTEYSLAGHIILCELLTHHMRGLIQSTSRFLFQSGFDDMNDVNISQI